MGRAKASVAAAVRAAVAPTVVVMVLLLMASASAVGGVFILAGLGWALIAAAVIQFIMAALMLRGLAGEVRSGG